MSEPVTNAEIEDVLSAVRRLVSESGAPRREERRPETYGKLVLTPAFRVDTVADPKPAVEPATTAEQQPTDEAKRDDRPMASVESLVQRAVSGSPEPVTSQVDEDDDWDEPEALADDAAQTTADDEAPEAGFMHVETEDDGVVASLEDRIAELEAVVTEAEVEEWEPDGSETPEAPTTVIFRHAGAASGPRFETSFDEGEDESAEEPAASHDMPAPDPEGVGEAAEIDVQEWEDVDATAATYAVPDVEEDDDDYEAPYAAAPEQVMGDYEIGENTADDMVIDEDMLREIVGRLVREELQGTMGERITRNLRRMVRREIARAIALKDFD